MKNWCGYNKKELKLIRDFIHEVNNEIIVRISTDKSWKCVLPLYKLFLGAKKQEQWVEEIRLNWCKEQEFYCEANMNIISLLHEIGHFQTFNLEEWQDRNKQVNELQNLYCEDKIDMLELNCKYFDLPNEYKATKWAFEYYKANKSKCDSLAKILRV
jgi:hypothetical protein